MTNNDYSPTNTRNPNLSSNTTSTTHNLAPNVTIIQPHKQVEDVAKLLGEGEDKPKLKVCAYARVSTEMEEQQNSYEAQVAYYTKYIKNNPEWEFIGVYADEGITGTSTKKRAGFNKMMKDAMDGNIDLILTKSISRFARNTVDALSSIRKLKERKVEVYFEKENIHSLDSKGEMMLTIMSSLAQEESRSISENVRWGKEKSMQKGRVYMPYKRFLGYKKGEDGRPEIVPEEAEIVKLIYNTFLTGMTLNDMAKYLSNKNIPTPGGQRKWYVHTIRSILSNEKYKGDAILQKTYTEDFLTKKAKKNNGEKPIYKVDNSHPAIIDKDTFNRVQEELKRRSNASTHKKNREKASTTTNDESKALQASSDNPTNNPKALHDNNSPPERNETNVPLINNETKVSFTAIHRRIKCGDCGSYYGHKVWRSRGKLKKKHDVWYCNHRYTRDKGEKCNTPTLREDDIKEAFKRMIKILNKSNGVKYDPEYSDALWRELVECVTITSNNKAMFKLGDGKEITVNLPKRG